MRPLRWFAESAPLGEDRVKVSENLGATSVAPVAPVDTSLIQNIKAGLSQEKNPVFRHVLGHLEMFCFRTK